MLFALKAGMAAAATLLVSSIISLCGIKLNYQDVSLSRWIFTEEISISKVSFSFTNVSFHLVQPSCFS